MISEDHVILKTAVMMLKIHRNKLHFTFSRCFYPKRLTNEDNISKPNVVHIAR